MTTGTETLVLKDLAVSHDSEKVLSGADLNLYSGEVCCVIGEEGSGKTTLVSAITSQIAASGTRRLRNIDLARLATYEMSANGVDFVTQGGSILEGFTVAEHIGLAMSRKTSEAEAARRDDIRSLMPAIDNLTDQIGGRLSGGERMLVSIACMIATDCEMLILDEPTAGLAPATCDQIETLVRVLSDKGKTLLLMEHNYEFAFRVADSIVTLKGGCLSRKYSREEFTRCDFLDTELYGIPEKRVESRGEKHA